MTRWRVTVEVRVHELTESWPLDTYTVTVELPDGEAPEIAGELLALELACVAAPGQALSARAVAVEPLLEAVDG